MLHAFPPSRVALCLLSLLILIAGCVSGPQKGSPTSENDPLTWEKANTTTSDGRVVVEKVSYRSDGLLINGQVCRPAAPGRHPVHVINHGGFSGIPKWNGGTCVKQAREGTVVAESSYRGEDGSQGAVEVCLGEVTDVLRMTAIVLAQPYADTKHMMMSGASHGGCITTRAVQRGAPVQLAVNAFGPSDWTKEFEFWSAPAQQNSTQRHTYNGLMQTLIKATGGTPEQVPDQYRRRSPRSFAPDLAGAPLPFMNIQSGADPIVPAEQGCLLAATTGGFDSYHVAKNGSVSTRAPAGCEHIALTWKPGPRPTTFPGQRYLLVYDELPHGLYGPSAAWAIADAMHFMISRMPR